MTVRLTVDEDPWLEHIDATIAAVNRCAQPVAVVKGNGYGFGRADLAARAMNWVTHIAVGTVHELDGLPHEANIIVLTPTLRPFDRFTLDGRVVLTVGAPEHIAAIAGSKNRVLVKIETSMQRYGGGHDLVEQARADLEAMGNHLSMAANAFRTSTESMRDLNAEERGEQGEQLAADAERKLAAAMAGVATVEQSATVEGFAEQQRLAQAQVKESGSVI